MMLAPTLAGNGPRTVVRRKARPGRRYLLDAALLAGGLAVCAALIFDGGLEAMIGAMIGATVSARSAEMASVISSAFAGLFVGALFAGFFHGALVALATSLF